MDKNSIAIGLRGCNYSLATVSLVAGVAGIVGAWWFAGTIGSVLALIVSFPFICLSIIQRVRLRDVFLVAVLSQIVLFHWIGTAVYQLHGQNLRPALFALVASVLWGALEFTSMAWVMQKCSRLAATIYIPIVWFLFRKLFPRVFPWDLGHLTLPVAPLAGGAAFVGVSGLSAFLVFFSSGVAEAAYRRQWRYLLGGVPLLVLTGWSWFHLPHDDSSPDELIRIAVIQSSVRNKVAGPREAAQRYAALITPEVVAGADLLVFPETVVYDWVDESVQSLSGHPLLSLFRGLGVPIILGALSTNGQDSSNSVFAFNAEEQATGLYRKVNLFPFMEYVPVLGETFAQFILPAAVGYTVSGSPELLAVQLKKRAVPLRVGVMICYDDLTSSVAMSHRDLGADFLLSVSSDVYLSSPRALLFHHMLAAFRAIETGLYLVRATNGGISEVITPTGAIMGSLAPFTEGVLMVSIPAGSR